MRISLVEVSEEILYRFFFSDSLFAFALSICLFSLSVSRGSQLSYFRETFQKDFPVNINRFRMLLVLALSQKK